MSVQFLFDSLVPSLFKGVGRKPELVQKDPSGTSTSELVSPFRNIVDSQFGSAKTSPVLSDADPAAADQDVENADTPMSEDEAMALDTAPERALASRAAPQIDFVADPSIREMLDGSSDMDRTTGMPPPEGSSADPSVVGFEGPAMIVGDGGSPGGGATGSRSVEDAVKPTIPSELKSSRIDPTANAFPVRGRDREPQSEVAAEAGGKVALPGSERLTTPSPIRTSSEAIEGPVVSAVLIPDVPFAVSPAVGRVAPPVSSLAPAPWSTQQPASKPEAVLGMKHASPLTRGTLSGAEVHSRDSSAASLTASGNSETSGRVPQTPVDLRRTPQQDDQSHFRPSVDAQLRDQPGAETILVAQSAPSGGLVPEFPLERDPMTTVPVRTATARTDLGPKLSRRYDAPVASTGEPRAQRANGPAVVPSASKPADANLAAPRLHVRSIPSEVDDTGGTRTTTDAKAGVGTSVPAMRAVIASTRSGSAIEPRPGDAARVAMPAPRPSLTPAPIPTDLVVAPIIEPFAQTHRANDRQFGPTIFPAKSAGSPSPLPLSPGSDIVPAAKQSLRVVDGLTSPSGTSVAPVSASNGEPPSVSLTGLSARPLPPLKLTAEYRVDGTYGVERRSSGADGTQMSLNLPVTDTEPAPGSEATGPEPVAAAPEPPEAPAREGRAQAARADQSSAPESGKIAWQSGARAKDSSSAAEVPEAVPARNSGADPTISVLEAAIHRVKGIRPRKGPAGGLRWAGAPADAATARTQAGTGRTAPRALERTAFVAPKRSDSGVDPLVSVHAAGASAESVRAVSSLPRRPTESQPETPAPFIAGRSGSVDASISAGSTPVPTETRATAAPFVPGQIRPMETRADSGPVLWDGSVTQPPETGRPQSDGQPTAPAVTPPIAAPQGLSTVPIPPRQERARNDRMTSEAPDTVNATVTRATAPIGESPRAPLETRSTRSFEPDQSRRDRFASETGDFSGELRSFETAPSTVQPASAMPRTAGYPHPVQQIADHLNRPLDGTVEVELSPADLGRVRLVFVHHDGGLTVSLSADRPETLDFMRRNVEQLAQELRQLGYERTGFDFASSGGGAGRGPNGHAARAETDGPVIATATDNAVIPAPSTTATGLDLRV